MRASQVTQTQLPQWRADPKAPWAHRAEIGVQPSCPQWRTTTAPTITVTETPVVPAVEIHVVDAAQDAAKTVKETVVKETVTLKKSVESDD
jgi:hypothetical protein